MRVYVIGNVAVDETISVATMPEAGASIFGREESRDLGGKGANQAVVIGRCGLPTSFVTAIGEDFRGETIREQLASEPVDARLLQFADASSDFSIIFTTPDGENAIVTTTRSAEAMTLAAALDALSTAQAGDIVVMQGNLSEDVTLGLLADAKRRGIVTAFNPSPLRPYFCELWPLVDMAFLNKGEALSLTGTSGEAAAAHLMAAGVRQVVLTAGGEGALLAEAEGIVTIPSAPASVVDTTGAGDTFMAVAIASAARRTGRLDERAISDAARASAITVSRRGTRSAFPSSTELAAILAG